MPFGPDFEPVEVEGLWCLRSRRLQGVARVRHAFTTRRARMGSSDPLADPTFRARLLAALGFDPQRAVAVTQRHTARAVVAERADAGRQLGVADAVVTAEPGLVLSVRTSDCLPVLLVDPEAGVVAAAHAGWRGLARGILARVVEVMVARGARADRITAVGGPSVGPCCYEVDGPVVEALKRWAEGALLPTRPGHWKLDLRAVARVQLRDVGVSWHRMSFCPACTACHGEWFFSYRRDGRVGRMEGLIALEP
ncbi:MAG: peptidoglycan editing factor PgeF [Armatimonadota bacterium]|nr:peptidoglycan editing factor PgeF [Armatimonadota bacterium]MDR7445331.1 peptidoglycan editing factor PgeF [Armatimonadota bacterium]MDR7569812.1 peptidoglycan editing factor PgeF [Armatimonadota bacterium]MDR7614065.1 peptidoglycan editing factor PgeF [Armatimonadota bacterium]